VPDPLHSLAPVYFRGEEMRGLRWPSKKTSGERRTIVKNPEPAPDRAREKRRKKEKSERAASHYKTSPSYGHSRETTRGGGREGRFLVVFLLFFHSVM